MKRPEVITAALVVVAFVAGVIESPYFLNAGYLLGAGTLFAEAGILSLGMTFVIVAGQIDLSVASMMVLDAALTARILDAGASPVVASLAALAIGCGLGLTNGLLVAKLRLPSIMVTVATLAGFRGAAQAMLGAESAKVPSSFQGFDLDRLPGTPIPLPLVVFCLAAVASGLILHRTVFGRWVYAVGTNSRAAEFSAVPVGRVTAAVFAISGLCAGLGALLIDSRLGVARYDSVPGLELDVITAVVLGGASIYGGRGTILGTFLAVVLVMLVRTGMLVANVGADYQLSVIGSLLILAVLITGFFSRGKRVTA